MFTIELFIKTFDCKLKIKLKTDKLFYFLSLSQLNNNNKFLNATQISLILKYM